MRCRVSYCVTSTAAETLAFKERIANDVSNHHPLIQTTLPNHVCHYVHEMRHSFKTEATFSRSFSKLLTNFFFSSSAFPATDEQSLRTVERYFHNILHSPAHTHPYSQQLPLFIVVSISKILEKNEKDRRLTQDDCDNMQVLRL